jgi:hypothetical protein
VDIDLPKLLLRCGPGKAGAEAGPLWRRPNTPPGWRWAAAVFVGGGLTGRFALAQRLAGILAGWQAVHRQGRAGWADWPAGADRVGLQQGFSAPGGEGVSGMDGGKI